MLNENKISEIKIIITGLLKDLDSLSENEMVSHIKWEDLLMSASMISQKLNTLRIEQERNNMKRYLLREDALDILKSQNEQIIRLTRELQELKSYKEEKELSTEGYETELTMEENYVLGDDFKGEENTEKEKTILSDDSPEEDSPEEDSVEEDSVEEDFSSGVNPDSGFDNERFELQDGGVVNEDEEKDDYPWMTDKPGTVVDDIHDAVTLNDKLCFLGDLFGGDTDLYKFTLNRINELGSFREALSYLRSEFPNWDESSTEVYRFYMIVRRRFDV